jgi:recombinational DNA repair protein (RecF pathway)
MAYHLYETEAFILGGRPHGEDSRLYFLFTPRWGLILAQAQGVRKLSSKLKHHLAEHSLVKLSLVRGREVWRLIGAEKILTLQDFSIRSPEAILLVRLQTVLRQLLAGPEESSQLFGDLRSLADFLLVTKLTSAQLRSAEAIFLLRLLEQLGYLPPQPSFKEFLQVGTWSVSLLDEFSPVAGRAIKEINSFFDNPAV